MTDIKSLGQVAFEAYRAEVVTAFNGDPIPSWDKLDNGAPARRGWEAAAQAVREHARMIAALDAAAAAGPRVKDFRERQQSRWQPVAPGMWTAPVGEPEPEFSAPIGRGEAPTGKHVAVEAGPDEER